MVDRADVLDDGLNCKSRICRLGLYYIVDDKCRCPEKRYKRTINEHEVWFLDCHRCNLQKNEKELRLVSSF